MITPTPAPTPKAVVAVKTEEKKRTYNYWYEAKQVFKLIQRQTGDYENLNELVLSQSLIWFGDIPGAHIEDGVLCFNFFKIPMFLRFNNLNQAPSWNLRSSAEFYHHTINKRGGHSLYGACVSLCKLLAVVDLLPEKEETKEKKA